MNPHDWRSGAGMPNGRFQLRRCHLGLEAQFSQSWLLIRPTSSALSSFQVS